MPFQCLTDTSNNITTSTFLFEAAGWAGSACILTAYLHNWGESTNFTLNLVGSLCLLAICLKKKVYQPAIINFIWSIGSIYKYNTVDKITI